MVLIKKACRCWRSGESLLATQRLCSPTSGAKGGGDFGFFLFFPIAALCSAQCTPLANLVVSWVSSPSDASSSASPCSVRLFCFTSVVNLVVLGFCRISCFFYHGAYDVGLSCLRGGKACGLRLSVVAVGGRLGFSLLSLSIFVWIWVLGFFCRTRQWCILEWSFELVIFFVVWVQSRVLRLEFPFSLDVLLNLCCCGDGQVAMLGFPVVIFFAYSFFFFLLVGLFKFWMSTLWRLVESLFFK